jgi:cell division protein FtsI (penicillin-binding protein 3)
MSRLKKKNNITDRNGRILATDILSYDLYLHANALEIDPQVVDKLLKIFPDMSRKYITARLQKYKKGIVLIKKTISEEQRKNIFTEGVASAYLEKNYLRFYPYGNLFFHTLGYSSVDRVGLAGLEKKYHTALLTNDIATSLDLNLQALLHYKLENAVGYFEAKGASGMLVDLENYEVLASVSLPDFDPNRSLSPGDPAMVNKITSGAFEPGSVFKIFTLAFALKNGFEPDDELDLSEKIPLGNGKFVRDEHAKTKIMTITEAFYRSSNIGMALLSHKAGEDKFMDFLTDIHILYTNRKATTNLPESELASVNHPAKWYQSSKITLSYGYGVSLPPIYLLNIISGLFNNGKLKQFTYIKDGNRHTSYETMYDKKFTEKLKQIAAQVTQSGTGKSARAGKYTICGKTGTSEKFDHKIKRWDPKRKLTSFVAIFPCQKPKYALYIAVDEPQYTSQMQKDGKSSILQGGTVAAPIAGEIISTLLANY